jgi:diguanylate cyclase (GGDEF)-like protein
LICRKPTFSTGIQRRQLHNKDLERIRFFIGINAVLCFIIIYLLTVFLSPFLRTPSLFHRNIIGSYLSYFIPINIIAWYSFGQVGGILIFIFSCLSIILIVLRYAVFYYNIYIIFLGIAAVIGYRIFLNLRTVKNRSYAQLETLDVHKNTLSAQLARKERDISYAKSRVQRYAALKDLTEDLNSTLKLEEIASLITKKAFEIIGRSDRAFLFLVDEERRELELFYRKQLNRAVSPDIKKAEIFDNWVLKQRKSLIIEDLDDDFRFSGEAVRDQRDREFKSVIGVPLVSEKKVSGIIRMDSKTKGAYTQDDLRLLNIISGLAAVSIENAMLYQKTNFLAVTDSLTGLYVQRYFREALNAELKKAKAAGEKFSILMIDLDHFKECNDKYGHAAGDILLNKLAHIIKTHIEPGHISARYGGEEFAIILSGIDKKAAVIISEGIRQKVEASSFTLRRDQVGITVSIGVSSFPKDGSSAQEVLKKADENLYRAKEAGRNQVWPSSI